MRLVGQIHVTFKGERIRRDPSFWERIKRGLGGNVDLETDRVRVALEVSAIVDAIKRALVRLGFDNAVSLVIDDTVVFQDTDGKPEDLPDLLMAMSEHASLFGSGFKELRLAVEHEEAGLHLLVETRAFTEHKASEPTAYVSIGGRIQALEPKRGESADDYRARVAPLTEDRAMLDSAKLQFESVVGRLESALAAAMPEATVSQKRADAVVVRPNERQNADASDRMRSPMSPAYDPYGYYYPSPMGMMLDVMMISSFMHMMHPPMIHVMHPSGAFIGSADEVAANHDLVADDVADPGDPSAVDADHDAGGADADADGGGGDYDSGGDVDGGGDYDGGGDFGGGDFDGGGDFGGFD